MLSARKFYVFALMLGAAFASAPVMAQEVKAPQVAMRVGQHGDYTRVVFDFPKLTAYYANAEQGDIALTFDTDAEIATGKPKSPLILGLKKDKAGDSQKILIDIPDGATFKHYRLLRKVVIDIQAPGTQVASVKPPPPKEVKKPEEAKPQEAKVQEAPALKTPEPPKAEPKPEPVPAETVKAEAPKEEPPKQEPPKQETAKEEPASTLTPEEVKEQVTQAVKTPDVPARQAPNVIVDQLPPPPAEPEEQAAEEEPTKITISTVEPANVAAFTRFGTLWIVMDTVAAGAIAPDLKGPQSGMLGKPKVLRFEGGTAYRYAMPPESHLSVEKKSLAWEIAITKAKRQTLTSTQLNTVFDEETKKSKLMAELKGAGKVLELEDPVAGDKLFIVPTSSQDACVDQARRFPGVEVLEAAIGMVVRPLKDGVKVNRIEDFIMVTAQDGIDATPGAVAGPVLVEEIGIDDDKSKTRLFDFPNWRQGGITKLNENRRAIESKLASAKTPAERSEIMMKLALLYFANNFGPETLGVLRLIEMEDEEMPKNPNFVAVRGAASALAGQYENALKDLSDPALQQHPEVTLWIGYAAAATEQWHMANRSFPRDNYFLVEYPQNVAIPFTIYMAESALRLGNAEGARKLLQSLDILSDSSGDIEPHYLAAVAYLKGEAARQDGDFEEALRLWGPVASGLDRLYHAKASLALARLQLQEKKISLQEAIEALDSLRFAWRGDGLEVQILNTLGDLKIQNRQVLKGLQDLNTAVLLSSSLQLDPKPIETEISDILSGLFTADGAKDLSPLEAVSIYSEFEKYLPAGPAGTQAALSFADYLLRMDLLDKAATLFEAQLPSLPEDRIAEVGARLAAAYLLDGKPSQAIAALGKTAIPAPAPKAALERELLKARAQSQLNLTDEAIATLTPLESDDAKRLKADVLWRARKWSSAGDAIESLLPPPSTPLDEDKARLVLNAAVARKLSGEADKIQDLRNRYQTAMAATKLGPTFGVVTREGDDAGLSDRETILKIAGEVDMFSNFLDGYKSATGKGS